MLHTHKSILDRIGKTPLVELRGVAPEGCARILLKIESENPTGSMKDRMALAMIEAAEADGRLTKGGHIIEYTGGSTGVSLAMICAAKGYSLDIVTSDAFSIEKRRHMSAFGAKLTIVPSDEGRMDEALTHNMIEAAQELAEKTGGFWTDQLANKDQIIAYHEMGNEIWAQTSGELDAFVAMTGTAACCRGNSETLHEHNPHIHCVAVEPAESPVLSVGKTGAHKIEGTGAGFVVPLWDPSTVDDIATVSTQDAMQMARKLAASEGIFAGTSTGGNVAVAIELGKKLGPNATIVTIMCDSGVKYLSTPVYTEQGTSPVI
ncbi:PLP-dependent cysteine synthase family protein [Sphingorhabdus sp. EL138]|uniref:PLP-dependent cysteine synthase family protein n=1 Tax=Sphingorhabdus sp. EL138 TaxID=2073156 RepID=UPI000D69188C|nr:cysteine synthase family protein [Sphingorhabdus sp. EL138]